MYRITVCFQEEDQYWIYFKGIIFNMLQIGLLDMEFIFTYYKYKINFVFKFVISNYFAF